ncbi:MAG: pyrroline-5-carboxylate reductase [Candidatus Margulisiibacteriota bacterium]
MRIGFIGGGNMAAAIIGGVLRSDNLKSDYPGLEVIVSDTNLEQLERLSSKCPGIQTSGDNSRVVQSSQVVFLAVKPQNIDPVLVEIKSQSDNKLIISIAAGVTIRKLQSVLANSRIIRVMPNTPCLVEAGMSALSFADNVTDDDKQLAKSIFSAIGQTVNVDEAQINAVTGLSGSGPAFVYEVARALIEGGIASGLEPEVARKLAAQTLVGAGKMLLERTESPAELVKMVASPGGTTEAGLKVLSYENWQKPLQDAVIAAKNRADELTGK